jgi:predicted AAA+ superfamily ATPase
MYTNANLKIREKELLALEKIENKIKQLEKEFIQLELLDEKKDTSEIRRQLKNLYAYSWAIKRGLIKDETLDLICL